MDFNRKAYGKLLKWKEQTQGESAILIEGERRVGKSYLSKRFAEKEYESYIYLDFANIEKDMIELFENEMTDLDLFFLKLQTFYGVQLVSRKSCIIFDEVQMYPRARQMIKYLVADGRYCGRMSRTEGYPRNGIASVGVRGEGYRLACKR